MTQDGTRSSGLGQRTQAGVRAGIRQTRQGRGRKSDPLNLHVTWDLESWVHRQQRVEEPYQTKVNSGRQQRTVQWTQSNCKGTIQERKQRALHKPVLNNLSRYNLWTSLFTLFWPGQSTHKTFLGFCLQVKFNKFKGTMKCMYILF